MYTQVTSGISEFKFLNLDEKGALSSSLSESVKLATSFLFLGDLGFT